MVVSLLKTKQKKNGDNIGDQKHYKKYEVSIVIALSHFI